MRCRVVIGGAFPLAMRSRLKFSLVLRFSMCVGVFIWLDAFNALIGKI